MSRELSEQSKKVLAGFCDLGLTYRRNSLKGYRTDYDGTTDFYLFADDCRELAAALIEAAQIMEATK